MKRIIQGLQEFQNRDVKAEQELFEKLSQGQTPDLLFITCSDSRISPNLITKTRPGELFVLRNAGNIVPRRGQGPIGGELATIEYAVKALKVADIVVCGHTGCGAITGLLEPDSLEAFPDVAEWLEHSRPVFEYLDEGPERSAEERLLRAIQLNVLVQISHIAELSYIAQAIEEGKLRLHGWVYNIGTGHVEAFCGKRNDWVDLVSSGEDTATIARETVQKVSNRRHIVEVLLENGNH